MVILGKLKIWKFPFYVIAQFLGAFAGAAAVFGLYYDAFMDFTSGILSVTGINATGHIFASYPARHLSVLGGFIDQVVGTGMLVLCILAIIDGGNIGAPKGVEPLAIGLIIMAIGVSMGLNCGYPLNPARDLGPRLFTAAAGWGMEVFRVKILIPLANYIIYLLKLRVNTLNLRNFYLFLDHFFSVTASLEKKWKSR
uniref:Aquaporin-9-like n=1 Tax=Cyprinodon variegatus TaxID=28743 RepID=A0A3Q2EGB3_CYPVA